MLTEEVLIFLLALASGLSLFIGLAQALDGRPRRIPLRRPHAQSPHSRPHPLPARAAEPAITVAPEQLTLIEAAPATVGDAAPPLEEVPEPAAAAIERPVAEPALPEPTTVEPRAAEPVETERAIVSAAVAPDPVPLTPEERQALPGTGAAPITASPAATPPPSAAASPSDLVHECARLLQAGSHGALLAAVEPVLKARGRGRARAQASFDRALLWGMTGLASKAGGDEPGARAAFDQGLRALPRADTAEQGLALFHVAETVGAQLLAGGEAAADAAGSTLSGLRLSVGLLRAVAIAQPGQTAAGNGDAAVAGPGADELPPWGKALRAHLAVERAREALATAAGRRLATFMERGDHAGGHRWLRDALGWDELTDRHEVVEDAYWKPLGEEITRLSARAMEPGVEAAAARAALESAEAVAGALPPEALASPRMEEIRRRLWWAQTTLGMQRMEAGDAAGALDLLYRALRLAGGDPDRESETRRVLAEALDAQAAGATERIEGLLQSGARAAAEEAGQELCRVIDRGLAEGVSQEELAGALSKRQHLMSRIAQAD